MGLNDHSNKVIRTSLQALSGIKNPRLLAHYQKLALKFPEEQNYILANLQDRLTEFEIDLDWIRKNDLKKLGSNKDGKWYQWWKKH